MIRDVMLGLWIAAIALVVYVVIPAAALGRPRGRTTWTADAIAACVWAALTTVFVVPVLASNHLLNWMSSMLIPVTWPTGLWLYRYRAAPLAQFRRLYREVSLCVLSCDTRALRVPAFVSPGRIGFAAAITTAMFWPAILELRLLSAADYGTLETTRELLAGGTWVFAPAASIAAVLTRLSAAEPMHVLRFLRPLLLLACTGCLGVSLRRLFRSAGAEFFPATLVAAAGVLPVRVPVASLDGMVAVLFVTTLLPLAVFAVDHVHRRDWWHIAAGAVMAIGASVAPAVVVAAGHLEYEAAPRVALAVAGGAADTSQWLIVAPPEQRLEVGGSRYYDLAGFVHRYGAHAGDRSFRFDLPARELFVFVEKVPLPVAAPAVVMRLRLMGSGSRYRLANTRARIERDALTVCEAYRHNHARADVFYEDAELRVYHFVR